MEMYQMWFNLYRTFDFCMTSAMRYFLAAVKSSTIVFSGDKSKRGGCAGEKKAQLR